jgi:peptidoglycan L-alanyl-D-glutamate endopeptidase CwlK
MLTEISMARLNMVHPTLKKRIISLDQLIPSVNLQVTQGLRTWGQQDVLYQQGRMTPGAIVTNAPAGYSSHNFGYAVDVVPEDIMPGQPDWNISNPAWQKILSTAPSVGLAEGAEWKSFTDNPHLYLQELPADPTDAMREQFTDGGIIEVWKNFPFEVEDE